MTFRLKLTHFHNSAHVLVPDLRANTINTRFREEFPEIMESPPVLRWQDTDGDWIEIQPDDKDFETIIKELVMLKGIAHIQSGDIDGLPPISNILIVTKPDPKLYKLTKELSVYLLATFPAVTIYVDKNLQDRTSFKYNEMIAENPSWADRLQFWTTLDCDKYARQIHLVVTMGGDGTVLYTASMFQHQVPPIVAFHLGSLGFLTNFSFDSFKPTMTNILKGEGMNINIRMRLQCSVYKYREPATYSTNIQKLVRDVASDSEDDEAFEALKEQVEFERRTEIKRKVKEMDSKMGSEVADLGVCHDYGQNLITRVPKPRLEEFMTPTDSWQVLNEVTVDRGSNAGMLQLELFVDGNHVTTILADGLVIATATGSTAYSLSIGGSLIHPDKNSIIISPIAPHSLTARPMIIPGTKHLRICVPSASRTTAWASFDGRYRQELARGDSIMITASKYPAVTICRRDQSTDWFTGLTQVLNWNSRVMQKPLGSHL
ncbi:hypothetical protein CPC16_006895 [Podila verticillata]|nr:hypothetical protein BGZ59_007292 [Podila verticillata]KAF9387738.1 hypothetical protein CPC16_006895 [Podila verticillata]